MGGRPTAAGAARKPIVTRKLLIVTADDFGLHPAINDAVAQAAQARVLTAASLMVGAPAAAEAIQIAREMSHLRVGLHLVLTDGWPVLAPGEIPDLVGEDGRFADRMVFDSFRYCTSVRMRRQLRAEIRAQFEAFARSGLRLDHVNTHKHFHVHPGVLTEILRIGKDYGMAAVRVPDEPLWFARRENPATVVAAPFLSPWLKMMRHRLRRHGVDCNDRVFGMACSGGLDESRMLSILERLPAGVTEIYLHPAIKTRDPISESMREYRHVDELATLLSSRVREAVAETNAIRCGYADLWIQRRPYQP
jgi:hopanoid biosynthesis associated protein HpnK